jgi:MFS family permease
VKSFMGEVCRAAGPSESDDWVTGGADAGFEAPASVNLPRGPNQVVSGASLKDGVGMGLRSLGERVGINRATAGVLVAIGGLGLAEHLWRGFLGPYLETVTADLGQAVWVVAVFSAVLNLLEAPAYILGGRLAHRWGPRRTLAIGAIPLVLGFAVFATTQSPWAVVLTALLITNWEPLSLAATFDVVGASLPKERRTTAFALQSIQKRLPQVVGPLLGGLLFALGFGANLAVAFGLTAVVTLVQWRLLDRMQPKDAAPAQPMREVLAAIPPDLRRLLTAEIILRWSDWFTRDLAALYVIGVLGQSPTEWGGYLALAAFVALVTYVPVGRWVDRSPSPRPFIGLTFFLFALFPLNLALLPQTGLPVAVALAITYALNGLREIGEPARKALITTGFPPEIRARAVGLYWGLRSLAFWPAPLVAALLWTTIGPEWTFILGGSLGMLATLVFSRLVKAGAPP